MGNDRIQSIRNHLRKTGDPERAESLEEYFRSASRSGKEKLSFYGTPTSEIRELARRNRDLDDRDLSRLLSGPAHEERLLALLVLVKNFVASRDEAERKRIHHLYLSNISGVNHWDLVDISAEHLVGAHLNGKPKKLLLELAGSSNPWKRRIALMSTHYFLKAGDYEDFERVASMLVSDTDETIQEALGKSFAEAAKWDANRLDRFLRKNYKDMPKATLRLAVEKLPPGMKDFYLKARML